MDNIPKVKDGDKTALRNKRSYEEIAEANAKSTINFFNIAGTIVVIAGLIVGLLSSWNALITNVSLGIIIIGIGEILRYMNKFNNNTLGNEK